MLDNPVAGIRLASAKVIVSKKLMDVGVASVILGAIAPGKTRSCKVPLFEWQNCRQVKLQAIEAISLPRYLKISSQARKQRIACTSLRISRPLVGLPRARPGSQQ